MGRRHMTLRRKISFFRMLIFEVGVFWVNTKENGYEKEEKEFMDHVRLSVGDYLSGWLLPVLGVDKSDQLLSGESKRKL